ncbi:winged helix-turn-helix domain-containing protein [Streptomyces albogriseolus]|uniref:winged helix-turn-helix domain-containing protein n=1 Tax=Streptomyces albogriseolus TaxID=1887 RepID=UPI003F53FD21
MAHPDRAHTRDRPVSTAWGYGQVGDGRTVVVHIARLRRKLGPELRGAVRTVRRAGYTYVPPAALSARSGLPTADRPSPAPPGGAESPV